MHLFNFQGRLEQITFHNPFLTPFIITSKFGRRLLAGKIGFHRGIDIVPSGDKKTRPKEVRAVGRCKLVRKGYERFGGGNFVVFKSLWYDRANVEVKYMHLAELPDIEIGQVLQAKDLIGIMGSTGKCYGEHLHIEIWVNDSPINPEIEVSWIK